MAVRAEEITNIIKDRIQSFGQPIQTTNVGTVIEVHDGVARIYGLGGALSGELLEFPGGLYGLALNLEEDTVGAVLLGDETGVREGTDKEWWMHTPLFVPQHARTRPRFAPH